RVISRARRSIVRQLANSASQTMSKRKPKAAKAVLSAKNKTPYKEPEKLFFFEVDEYGTITQPDFKDPETNREIFDVSVDLLDLGRQRLLVLRDRLGVVDAHQHRAGGNVLSAHHRDLRNPSIDARRDVEPRGVDLALHQQRLRPHQIPD